MDAEGALELFEELEADDAPVEKESEDAGSEKQMFYCTYCVKSENSTYTGHYTRNCTLTLFRMSFSAPLSSKVLQMLKLPCLAA